MNSKYSLQNINLEEILHETETELLDDPTTLELIKNQKSLYKLILIQSDILNEYIKDFKINRLDEDLYKHFYEELDIPFAVTYKVLNSLKNKIIKLLKSKNISKHDIYEFSEYFQNLLDSIAKIYIKREFSSIKSIIESPFKKYVLFSTHLNWLSQIIESIEKDDMKLFPVENYKECEFAKKLFYPESLMVCIDKNLCIYLEDLHAIIHKMANSFYVFYTKKQFSEAYFTFRDFKEQVLKFKQIISELYFVTYSNVEKNFFKLIELLEYNQDIYLTMIDIKNLSNLNKVYGEQNITNSLLNFEVELQNYIDHEENNLLIKGLTSDFYLLNVNYSLEEHKKFIQDLQEKLKTIKLKIDDIKINFESLLITLKIDRFSEFKDIDLIRIFTHLKKEAKNKNLDLLYIEDISDIVKIIINENINEKFIYKKTNDKEVDVVFQPIYDTKTNKIFTLEALGRIVDDNKLIPAGVFIDKIYEMNLITKFDMAMLDKIIEKKDLIQKISPRIFININFQSLVNEEYLNKLKELFKAFDTTEVILELTEQKFIENYEIIEKIHKEHNIYFAVDDFGSGYSSLKALADLAQKGVLKILKIDGSLIKDILENNYDEKVVKVISKLGQELHLLTVAEYIENAQILELVEKLNIRLAQGYYLSKPKPIEDFFLDEI